MILLQHSIIAKRAIMANFSNKSCSAVTWLILVPSTIICIVWFILYNKKFRFGQNKYKLGFKTLNKNFILKNYFDFENISNKQINGNYYLQKELGFQECMSLSCHRYKYPDSTGISKTKSYLQGKLFKGYLNAKYVSKRWFLTFTYHGI